MAGCQQVGCRRHSEDAFCPDYLAFTGPRTYNLVAPSVARGVRRFIMKLRFIRWFLASLSLVSLCCPLLAQSSAAPPSSSNGAGQAASQAASATPAATPAAKDADGATPT